MNLNEQLDDNFNQGDLDLETRTAFLGAAKWSNYLVLIGGGIFGLTILLVLGVVLFANGEAYALLGLVFMLFFFGIPLYYLYQFSTKTKKAIEDLDDVLFTSALKNLKSFFKFIGVLTLLLMAYYLLIMLFLFTMASNVF